MQNQNQKRVKRSQIDEFTWKTEKISADVTELTVTDDGKTTKSYKIKGEDDFMSQNQARELGVTNSTRPTPSEPERYPNINDRNFPERYPNMNDTPPPNSTLRYRDDDD